jgi:hypothetical protein
MLTDIAFVRRCMQTAPHERLFLGSREKCICYYVLQHVWVCTTGVHQVDFGRSLYSDLTSC